MDTFSWELISICSQHDSCHLTYIAGLSRGSCKCRWNSLCSNKIRPSSTCCKDFQSKVLLSCTTVYSYQKFIVWEHCLFNLIFNVVLGILFSLHICSFVGRLFQHAFEDSRPKSVLVHSLSVCISLLDPKRLVSASYQAFRSQLSHGTLVTASPETVNGMLDSLG